MVMLTAEYDLQAGLDGAAPVPAATAGKPVGSSFTFGSSPAVPVTTGARTAEEAAAAQDPAGPSALEGAAASGSHSATSFVEVSMILPMYAPSVITPWWPIALAWRSMHCLDSMVNGLCRNQHGLIGCLMPCDTPPSAVHVIDMRSSTLTYQCTGSAPHVMLSDIQKDCIVFHCSFLTQGLRSVVLC